MFIVLLGGPGAGKGTVSNEICERYKLPHISTGDMLREEIAKESELGLEVKEILASGGLVSDEIVKKLIKNKLASKSCENGAILDGYPRTEKQAETLTEVVESIGKKLDFVIELDLPDDIIVERVINRRLCSNKKCGAIYNAKYNKPKVEGICDNCGSELFQRPDDNEETIKHRLKVYHEEAEEILKYYKDNGLLTTVHLNGTEKPQDLINKVIDIIED